MADCSIGRTVGLSSGEEHWEHGLATGVLNNQISVSS